MFIQTHILASNMLVAEFEFQTVGMIVVFSCLILLAFILTASGKVAQFIQAYNLGKTHMAGAHASVTAATTTPPVTQAPTQELTPELIAVIAAAVNVALEGAEHKIVNIQPSGSAYSSGGRSEIFASHRITPVRR